MIWDHWKNRFGKFIRQQIRAERNRFPPPKSAFTHHEREIMDRFIIRPYIPFPVEPFAQSDVKSGKVVIEIPAASTPAVFEETKDFPVKADKSDWDLSHPDVVNASREPYLTAPGGATGRPFLKASTTYEADQGASGVLRTFHLDDATPTPNPTEGEPVPFTVIDNVPPSAPTSAFLHSEGEINVPDAPPEEPPVEDPPVEDPPVEDPPANV